MSIPEPPGTAHEPTLWCGRCRTYMQVTWIPETPAWNFCCPLCECSGQVLP